MIDNDPGPFFCADIDFDYEEYRRWRRLFQQNPDPQPQSSQSTASTAPPTRTK